MLLGVFAFDDSEAFDFFVAKIEKLMSEAAGEDVSAETIEQNFARRVAETKLKPKPIVRILDESPESVSAKETQEDLL